MTTKVKTHPSETGGTTSKTRSDRLPAQPAVFFVEECWPFIRSFVRKHTSN